MIKTKPKTHKLSSRSSDDQCLLTANEIEAFFEIFAALNPTPKGELQYTNAFTLLVAVILSAQATDAAVNKATRPLFAIADTPQKMLALSQKELEEYIKTIGLFRSKAKHILACSSQLIERHDGCVPSDRTALEKLAGVGRKTANVVLNTIFHQPTIAVDTHLFRVANRTGLAKGTTPLEVELVLEKRIPQKWKVRAHHWLILHGRYICQARKPKCAICPVQALCKFPDKVM